MDWPITDAEVRFWERKATSRSVYRLWLCYLVIFTALVSVGVHNGSGVIRLQHSDSFGNELTNQNVSDTMVP